MIDVDKYQDVKVTLTTDGKPVRYRVISGEILEAQKQAFSETVVSGGGGGPTNQTISIGSSTTTWTEETIFFKVGDIERTVVLKDNPASLRPGNHVSFLLFQPPREEAEDRWILNSVVNHSADRYWESINRWWQSTGRPAKATRMEITSASTAFISFLPAALFFGLLLLALSSASSGTMWLGGSIGGMAALAIWGFFHLVAFQWPMLERIARDFQSIRDCMRNGNALESLESTAEQIKNSLLERKKKIRRDLVRTTAILIGLSTIVYLGYRWNLHSLKEKELKIRLAQFAQSAEAENRALQAMTSGVSVKPLVRRALILCLESSRSAQVTNELNKDRVVSYEARQYVRIMSGKDKTRSAETYLRHMNVQTRAVESCGTPNTSEKQMVSAREAWLNAVMQLKNANVSDRGDLNLLRTEGEKFQGAPEETRARRDIERAQTLLGKLLADIAGKPAPARNRRHQKG